MSKLNIIYTFNIKTLSHHLKSVSNMRNFFFNHKYIPIIKFFSILLEKFFLSLIWLQHFRTA